MALMSASMKLSGMSCASCANHVERALRGTPGVTEASVNLAAESARVQYDPERTTVEELQQAVERAGYRGQVE